jgi:hypothetical protein
MPTVRKKFMKQKKDRPKRDSTVLTEARYHWLISRIPELIDEPNPFSSKEDEKTCYEANKDTIMERWLSDPKHYCTRPKCFHWFEDAQRRQIGESDHQWLKRLGLLQEREIPKFRELEEWDAKQRAKLI